MWYKENNFSLHNRKEKYAMGDIIRGIRKPMDRGLKYPHMVCVCQVIMTLNTRYNK